MCKCDCGSDKDVYVSISNLTTGHTKSCGCLRNETLIKKMNDDMIGKKFSRLTVLYLDENKTSNNRTYWMCQCDCGSKPKSINGSSLKNGNTKSCGCYRIELALEKMNNLQRNYNTYDLSGEYGIGYTFNGEEFYFDLEDYDKIKDYCWHIHDKYVQTLVKGKTTNMHRLIMEVSDKDIIVDHIKHIEHDNRKSQLRLVIKQKNNMNHTMYSNNTSGVNGVTWNKRSNKWIARITYKNKPIYLGRYDDFDDAVAARKEAEEKYFGEYSYDNSMNKDNIKQIEVEGEESI